MPERAGDNRTVCLDGERLIQLRRTQALSREQLAELSSGPHRISGATIKRAEGGAAIYLETARRIAALLGVPLEVVLATRPRAESERPGARQTSVALAILPFDVVGSEPIGGTIAAGLTEDLAIRLGNWWFPVISPSSSRAYVADQVERAASELEVAYLVQGSVQTSGGQLRVRCRLVRAATGEQLWCAEYTRTYADLFQLQDQLTNDIVDRVNRRLLLLESQRLQGKSPELLSAWELAVRGTQFFYEATAVQNRKARECLLACVRSDPSVSSAWYLLALTHQRDLVNQWTESRAHSLAELQSTRAEFTRWHGGDARADVVAAYACVSLGKRSEAAQHSLRAIENMPNLSNAYCLYGQVLAMGGEPDKALEQLEISMRLSPCDSQLWSVQLATALTHFVAERYSEAVTWAEAAAASKPDVPIVLATVASASALMGDVDRARATVAQLLQTCQSVSRTGLQQMAAATAPEIRARYQEGLRIAGLPL